jgi:hypothetical protein
MMELNKYDLVEYLSSSLFDYINCSYCPIRKECDERKEKIIICSDEEKIRKTLIKKYNL